MLLIKDARIAGERRKLSGTFFFPFQNAVSGRLESGQGGRLPTVPRVLLDVFDLSASGRSPVSFVHSLDAGDYGRR